MSLDLYIVDLLAYEGVEGVVKERMDLFKENKAAMKTIKRNLSRIQR